MEEGRDAKIKEAMELVQMGHSVNGAAKLIGVPKSTLQSRMKQSDPTKVRSCRIC